MLERIERRRPGPPEQLDEARTAPPRSIRRTSVLTKNPPGARAAGAGGSRPRYRWRSRPARRALQDRGQRRQPTMKRVTRAPGKPIESATSCAGGTAIARAPAKVWSGPRGRSVGSLRSETAQPLRPPRERLRQACTGEHAALPVGEVDVLDLERRERSRRAPTRGDVERAEITRQRLEGPGVGDDVVHRKHQHVLGRPDRRRRARNRGPDARSKGVVSSPSPAAQRAARASSPSVDPRPRSSTEVRRRRRAGTARPWRGTSCAASRGAPRGHRGPRERIAIERRRAAAPRERCCTRSPPAAAGPGSTAALARRTAGARSQWGPARFGLAPWVRPRSLRASASMWAPRRARRSARSTRSSLRTRDATRVARSECPPSAKKLSCTPMRSTCRTSAHTRARIRSWASRGATCAADIERSSAGSPFRSILPFGVTGTSSSITNAEGSMCSGKPDARCERTSSSSEAAERHCS